MEEAVFARIQALERRRKALEDTCSTPAEVEYLSKADLEELRRLLRPPKPVQQCLEVVYIALHVDKVAPEILRAAPGTVVAIQWKSVQTMLARFDTFFPMMEDYDIAGLMAKSEVARYVQRTYFGEEGLTQERVKRCSVAAAALFQWCSRSLARVEAALELLLLKDEIMALRGQVAPRWRCETDGGWVEYPKELHEDLEAADKVGGTVKFDLNGMPYEADLPARTQKNLLNGFLRPIRPPGDTIDLRALQGSWHTSWGSDVVVRGTRMAVDGLWVGPEFDQAPDGVMRWTLGGDWRVVGGCPLAVDWGRGPTQVSWVATAHGKLPRPDSAPAVVNDEGAPVRLSRQPNFDTLYYCGRHLGKASIPGSDGRCGPSNGPQCGSCIRFQAGIAAGNDARKRATGDVYLDATNCLPSITVSPDGARATWGDNWGGVAVRRTSDNAIPTSFRMRATGTSGGQDICIAVAGGRVSDLRSFMRPHGEPDGDAWLIRGGQDVVDGDTDNPRLVRRHFEYWNHNNCRTLMVKDLPSVGAFVEVRWDGKRLSWCEDFGEGLQEQAHLDCGDVDLMYLWSFMGGGVELLG